MAHIDRHHDYIQGEFIYGDTCFVPEEYMDENWWYIDEAPSYMISDEGRIWSEKTQRFIKPKPMDREGHLGVCLTVNGKPRYFYLHRLMAKAFIPNPNNYPIVRHLNDIPYNNELNNLAWGTQRDNWHDSKENGHVHYATPEEREKGLQKLRKPIIAVNLKTGEEIKFEGQNEASRILGIQQANIWKVLNGRRVSTCGWYFKYLKEGDN